MSARHFVDTNILVYAHDTASGAKHAAAKALLDDLWQTRSGVISTQVLQELVVSLQRKVARPPGLNAIREMVTDYLSWEVVVNTPDSILAALEIQQRYRLSFWDAIVIQAAESAAVEVLYSEDFSDGQVFGAVRVVNPLQAGRPQK